MNNFHEEPLKDEQRDIFDEPEKKDNSKDDLEVISKQQLDDLYDDVDQLAETGFEHEFEDEIDEETAKLNELGLKEDEPYAEIMGEKKQVYKLYNKAHGSQGDEFLGKVGAYSDAQALEEGHRKEFNMSENTFVVGTGEFYIPRKKKKIK